MDRQLAQMLEGPRGPEAPDPGEALVITATHQQADALIG